MSSPSGRSDRRSPGAATAEAGTRQRYPGRHADAAARVYAPLLTLYDAGEEIDVDATAALGLRLVEAGVHGLVLSGSTGEFHLHTPVERQTLLEAVIAACPSGTPVLAQVGAPSQRDAMALAGTRLPPGPPGSC